MALPVTAAGWQGAQYSYEGEQPHAVTSVERGAGEDEFVYDANGNMTQRVESGVTWTQGFNSENRLASVSNGTDTWTFVYDGDGNRVKQINPDSTITLFLAGGSYTVVDASGDPEVTSYYAIAGQRIAMQNAAGLQYLLTDHLGSVSAVLTAAGALVENSEQRYMPFGAERLLADEQTDFGNTGQRDLAAAGLMDYNARWYDAGLGRWTQPDLLAELFGHMQELNRYSYVGNNPVRYVDPTGQVYCELDNSCVQSLAYGICYYCQGKTLAMQYGESRSNGGSDLPICKGISDKRPCRETEKSEEPEENIPPICNAFPNVHGCPGVPEMPSLPPEDYVTFTFGLGPPPFTVHASFTIDEYGQKYFGLGIEAGKSFLPVSASLVAGRLPAGSSKKEIQGLLSDGSFQIWFAPIIYLGKNYSGSSDTSATESGFSLPGVGGGWTWSWALR